MNLNDKNIGISINDNDYHLILRNVKKIKIDNDEITPSILVYGGDNGFLIGKIDISNKKEFNRLYKQQETYNHILKIKELLGDDKDEKDKTKQ